MMCIFQTQKGTVRLQDREDQVCRPVRKGFTEQCNLLDVRLCDILADLNFDGVLLEHVNERQKFVLQRRVKTCHVKTPALSEHSQNCTTRCRCVTIVKSEEKSVM